MKILWLTTAEQDLEALVNYIAEDNPKIALRIFRNIRQSVENIAKYPSAGRIGRVEHTRELVIPKFPYIIVYIIAKEIKILAVLHTSRKWPSSF